VSAIDSNGRTIWIADAHRGDGQRFVVRADEMLIAFRIGINGSSVMLTRRGDIPHDLTAVENSVKIYE
jgi:hypothetical protein